MSVFSTVTLSFVRENQGLEQMYNAVCRMLLLDKTVAAGQNSCLQIILSNPGVSAAYAANSKYILPLRLRMSRATKGAGDTCYLVYEISVLMTLMITNIGTHTHALTHARHTHGRTHASTHARTQTRTHARTRAHTHARKHTRTPYMPETFICCAFCKHVWV